ncbi:MAG TPA: hypothetical protein VFL27_11150 [Candidatus Dormibacteraeota bacterium]|nr:hypothetical protein [Candidatus Dormibacteraeota bacterium]
MTYRRLAFSVSLITALVAALSAVPASANTIPVIDDSQLQALTTTVGGVDGAPALMTSNTIAHWFGSTADPHNGVTYGYNMVGADPNTCSGSACDVTIQADVQPLIVNVGGFTFDGRSVMDATRLSPLFANNDYSSTPFATTGAGNIPRGPGGPLSQLETNSSLQLEDATMRAQFNTYGSYHVRLQWNALPAVSIDVPATKASLALSGRGVLLTLVDATWWATRIQELMVHADPTHLPIYTTSNVLLFSGPNCCIIGFHGAGLVPGNPSAVNGSGHGNGNQPVQTFAWATYLTPGIYARPNGGTDWAVQDIHPLSHEIAEWADDPFVNNFVEPWLTPTAPQYGCTAVMETGDPVVGIGFAMGTNTFQQGANPRPDIHGNPTFSADGFYHPEDEVFLPWFMRTPASQAASEPNQTSGGGRFTLMGDLNHFAGFHVPATGCA